MNTPSNTSSQDLSSLLGADHKKTRSRRIWRWLLILILAAGGGYWYNLKLTQQGTPTQLYQTEPVIRGNITVTVDANGNLEPTNSVEVGSELSGLVMEVFVDDNDRVKKDQILARLDTSKLKDEIIKSKATLASAQAKVLQAEATILEASANLSHLLEVERLSGGKVPAKTEMESAIATLERAKADEASARASVAEASATLSTHQTNLNKAAIRSPIDGIVLSRNVEPGQTVAAQFTTPVMFTIAEDLTKMELQVDVDEADVGKVREGQSAIFEVDAYSGRKYPAHITRVGYGSQTTDGVVSYLTLMSVDNNDLTLRPGMTATAEIITVSRENVLLIPNAALRFAPPDTSKADAQPRRGLVGMLLPRPPIFQPTKTPTPAPNADGSLPLWILQDGQLKRISVKVGVTDGTMTEVIENGLKEGMEVVTETLVTRP